MKPLKRFRVVFRPNGVIQDFWANDFIEALRHVTTTPQRTLNNSQSIEIYLVKPHHEPITQNQQTQQPQQAHPAEIETPKGYNPV